MKYKTRGYYDFDIRENTFSLAHKSFDKEIEKSFDDSFFNEWLENPVAFGAFENGHMLGYVEGSPEAWNNRYRISNIGVFDEKDRRNGIGHGLMQRILKSARESGARMIVLETQSCNEKAISFYKKHGFQIIGFDLYAYSNNDLEKNEVRIEMGLKLS